MRLGPDIPRRRPAENIVPMINIVFLLLVFFLLASYRRDGGPRD